MQTPACEMKICTTGAVVEIWIPKLQKTRRFCYVDGCRHFNVRASINLAG